MSQNLFSSRIMPLQKPICFISPKHVSVSFQRKRNFQLRCKKQDDKLTNANNGGESEPDVFDKLRKSLKDYPKFFLGPAKEILSGIDKIVPKQTSGYLHILLAGLKHALESYKDDPKKVYFLDIVGLEEAKSELELILSRFQQKIESKKLDMIIPNGVLLYGPPGTGKTILVHALARQAGVSFFPTYALEIAKPGPDSADVKSLFKEAKDSSPSIIFIKNLDLISSKANELYKEMDKCHDDGNTVLVIATSSHREKLDPNYNESGRFYRKVETCKPNEEDRRKFVGLYLNGLILEEEQEKICQYVATETPDTVRLDIENIAIQASDFATRRGSDQVKMEDLVKAVKRFKSDKQDKYAKDRKQSLEVKVGASQVQKSSEKEGTS